MEKYIEDFFWSMVKKTSTCWNWSGSFDKNNPMFELRDSNNCRKEYQARRISLELNGVILLYKKPVRYACGNHKCVNFNHLQHGDSARFWSKVTILDKNKCWMWHGATDRDGYGKFTLNNNKQIIRMQASRYAYEEFYNKKISTDMLCCHKCDNPTCVNPHHIFLGTHKDNMKDMVSKNRSLKGSRHHQSILTEKQVIDIKLLIKQSKTINYIANLYNVSEQCIYAINEERNWRHII